MNHHLIRRNLKMTEGALISHDSVNDTVSINMRGIRDTGSNLSEDERAELRGELDRIMGELGNIRAELESLSGISPWAGGALLSDEELTAMVSAGEE